MTILIYSISKEPTLVERATAFTLQKIFPSEKVAFSATLNTIDKQSDSRFTLVIPGGHNNNFLEVHDNHVDQNILEGMDLNAHFMGFCAGAFYGAQHYIPMKSRADETVIYHDFTDDAVFLKEFLGSLNMVDGSCAIGPILPYQNAKGDGNKMYSHATTLVDAQGTTLPSLYMEGPIFLNLTKDGPYGNQNKILAHYELDYSLNINIRNGSSERKNPFKRSVTLGNSIPAVLHEEYKGSHRFLFGPHPELAATARTFMPAFEKEFSKEVAPLSEKDSNILCTAESEQKNLAFLQKAFAGMKL